MRNAIKYLNEFTCQVLLELPGLVGKIGGNILKLVMVVNRIYFGTRLILLSLIFTRAGK